MNPKKSSRIRWGVWLVGGALSLLLLAAFVYGMLRDPGETLSISDPGIHSPHPTELRPAASAIPEIDVKELSGSLAQALDSRLDEWDQRSLELFEENRSRQAQVFSERQEELDRKIEKQSSRLKDMDQRLRSLEHGVNRLLASLEDEAFRASVEPAFTFRGIEVWHGQAYALLEHQGRILPARQGESRLGWKIHAIDRTSRKLHVGDGVTELVLEER